MSKSRGTFITAKQFHEIVPSDTFRYYLASKTNGHLDDIDFNFEEFRTRINADLVGKIVNIASRCAKFINLYFHHQLSSIVFNQELLDEIRSAKEELINAYHERQYAKAVRNIMAYADRVNQFIDQEKPWVFINDPEQHDKVQAICTLGLELFRVLINYLKPILPILAEKVETFLGIQPLNWATTEHSIFGQSIKLFQSLMHRIQESDLDQLKATLGQA